MRQRGRKAVTGRRIRVDSRRRRQPVGHGEGFLLATLLQSVLCAMMLALAFAASQYWGLTGIKSCFAAALSDGGKYPQLVPIDEGSVIDLGGGVTVDVLNLGGHTENSVVFACAHYKALFTGDAIGSGYIILMICPEKDMYKVLESYKKNLECFLPRAEALRDYAWFGGHSIQENGCDEQHQQDYLAGRSVYYNPLRIEIVQDMVVLCEKLITGEISKADVMSTDEHYCNYGSAGMYFRFI